MSLVIDASAAAALCLSAKGFGLVSQRLSAPALLRSETLSALQGLQWRGEISGELADLAVARLLDAPIRFVRRRAMYREARRLASRLGWAKTYDAEYIALALSTSVPLLSLDQRLARRASKLIEVRLPSDL